MAKIFFITGAGGASSNPVVATEAAGTHSMVSADTNTIYNCTAGGGCVVTVEANQQVGTTTEFVRRGGALTFVGGGGLTFVFDSVTFDPEAAAVGSSVVVTILTATTALLRGDLAAA
jgi:hypothetical protein